jgi:hypothetical protein
MSDSRATNVLLVIVVGVSGLAAFLVAGIAILLMFQATTAALNTNLIQDLGTFTDVLHVFASQIYDTETASRMENIVAILGPVASDLTIKASLTLDQQNLAYSAAFLAQTADAWWLSEPVATYASIGQLAALWTEFAINTTGQANATAAADAVNALLPPSDALLVGSKSGGSVVLLTAPPAASQCPTGVCPGSGALDTLAAALAARDGLVLFPAAFYVPLRSRAGQPRRTLGPHHRCLLTPPPNG